MRRAPRACRSACAPSTSTTSARPPRHASFFQMCGNFSFGDYFKEGAIPFAWELLTDAEKGFGFDPERLWVTVFPTTTRPPKSGVDYVPAERIQRRGKEDNYWSMGVPGPCGPCSEIYFDRGAEYGADGGPVADEERYLEVWNLVFMQYERGEGAGYDYPILGDLPNQNIDTGLGLERMATHPARRGQPLRDRHLPPGARPGRRADRPPLRRGPRAPTSHCGSIADHTRTARDADRGRRHARQRGPRLRAAPDAAPGRPQHAAARRPRPGHAASCCAVVRDVMGPIYPELVTRPSPHQPVRGSRGGRRSSTPCEPGTTLFDIGGGAGRAPGGQHEAARRRKPSSCTTRTAFPIDLTLRDGRRAGPRSRRGRVPPADERAARARQARPRGARDRPRRPVRVPRGARATAASRSSPATRSWSASRPSPGCSARHGGLAGRATEGDEVERRPGRHARSMPRAVASSPTTAASSSTAASSRSTTCQRPVADLIVHRARVLRGELSGGRPASMPRSTGSAGAAISRSHTATHLVHRAFRGALGESATQAGLGERAGPAAVRLRQPRCRAARRAAATWRTRSTRRCSTICRPGVRDVARTRRAGSVRWRCSGRSTATRCGSWTVGEYSRELCGGTHVAALGPARRGEAARGVLDRRRGPAGRGAGRPGRVPVPGPRARAAQRGGDGCSRAPPEEVPERVAAIGRPAARRRTRSSSGCAPRRCWPSPASCAAGRGRRRVSRSCRDVATRHAVATCAGSLSTVRGRLAAAPGGRRAGPCREIVSISWSRPTRPPGTGG